MFEFKLRTKYTEKSRYISRWERCANQSPFRKFSHRRYKSHESRWSTSET